jgi:hypothetical protein
MKRALLFIINNEIIPRFWDIVEQHRWAESHFYIIISLLFINQSLKLSLTITLIGLKQSNNEIWNCYKKDIVIEKIYLVPL